MNCLKLGKSSTSRPWRWTPEDIEAATDTLKIVEDEGEREVLCARVLGITREKYINGASGSERRRREAAWRQLSRHGVPAELRKALREKSGEQAIIRPGFEDRAWRDLSAVYLSRAHFPQLDFLPGITLNCPS